MNIDIERLEREVDAGLRVGTLEVGTCGQCGNLRNCEVITMKSPEGDWVETTDGELAMLICTLCAHHVFECDAGDCDYCKERNCSCQSS